MSDETQNVGVIVLDESLTPDAREKVLQAIRDMGLPVRHLKVGVGVVVDDWPSPPPQARPGSGETA